MSRIYYILMSLCITLLAALLAGCQQKQAYVPPPPPAVTVSLPQQQEVTYYADFTGTTAPLASVDIRARVKGFLQKVAFQPGQWVNQGDVLFVIDPREFQAAMEQAEADLAGKQASQETAQFEYDKTEAAHSQGAATEYEWNMAKAKLSSAKASVGAAQAAVDQAKLNLSYTRVETPISGRVGVNRVDVGNLVGAGENSLLTTVVNDTQVYAYFNASESGLLTAMRKGLLRNATASQAAESQTSQGADSQAAPPGGRPTVVQLALTGEEGYPHKGYVDFVDNRVDPDTGTIRIRAIFPNENNQLLPGLFARVRIPMDTRQALLVPEEVLGTDQGGRYVLVIDDKNIVHLQPVEVGQEVGSLRVVDKGLKATDRVIVNGVQRARPGAPVTPQMTQEPPAGT